MYIIAIAWLYVAFLMAVSETSLVAGFMTLIFYGLLPCALLLWILGAPKRKRNKKNKPESD